MAEISDPAVPHSTSVHTVSGPAAVGAELGGDGVLPKSRIQLCLSQAWKEGVDNNIWKGKGWGGEEVGEVSRTCLHPTSGGDG